MFIRVLFLFVLSCISSSVFSSPITYTFDENHTLIKAQWEHMGFSKPYAVFSGVSGNLIFDESAPEKSSVSATIPLNKMTSFVDKLNNFLWSEKFFNVEKFPSIMFKSTSVLASGSLFMVEGDLTIKDVTLPVVVAATLNKKGFNSLRKSDAIGFDATVTLKRSAFNLTEYKDLVSDDVMIQVTAEAIKK